MCVALCVMMSACGNSDNKHKLYLGITTGNKEAVNEVLSEKSKVNLENLREGDETSFRMKDKRALGLDISSGFDDSGEIAMQLIENGADVNSVGDGTMGKCTYLSKQLFNRKVFNALIDGGADVNATDDNNKTAMYYLATGARVETMDDAYYDTDLLIKHGAKLSSNIIKESTYNEDGYMYTPYLLEKFENKHIDTGLSKSMRCAIAGDSKGLIEAVKAGKYAKKERKRIVLYASAFCSKDALKVLSDKGFTMDVTDGIGQNTLLLASMYNDIDVVKYLVSQNVNEKKRCNGRNVLSYAVVGAKKETVEYFLGRGYKWTRAEENNTWLGACDSGGEKAIKLMLEEGFVPNKMEMVLGYLSNNDSTLNSLIDNNIGFDATYKGDTALSNIALQPGACPYKLYKAGAKIDTNALIQLLQHHHGKLAVIMIKDMDVKELNKAVDGETPLSVAVTAGEYDSVKALVKKGVDVNKKITDSDKYTSTAMHTAARSASINILRYLIDHGGDLNIKDSDGDKPIDCAKYYELTENETLLK